MYETMIADLLDQCLDLDDTTPYQIEIQLKSLAGLLADCPLDLSA
ncbi:MAG: hypothetical protein Q8L20_03205 [Gammaproteobacteria bacterium]|nr:hypothetical protein [Gammaproteobacteria bacterium]